MTREKPHVVVIGAGIGGLVTALDLVRQNFAVTVVERAEGPGGKMRQVMVGGVAIDAGPTVLTLRGVFDDIFAAAGAALDERLTLRPLDVIGRHAWSDGSRLDLFADRERSASAIESFAGPREAAGYRRFASDTARLFQLLDPTFLRASRPSLAAFIQRLGPRGLAILARTNPFATMAGALHGYFRDPRLLQLFGRYATYCGSSPYRAPAVLLVVAAVEQAGVWRIDGGMQALADALADLAATRGVIFRYAAEAREILARGGRAAGVLLANGETVHGNAVVFNGDAQALATGLLGPSAVRAAPVSSRDIPSLSAITWKIRAPASGFPLSHHNVFFSPNYRAEFDALARGRLPDTPTVYVCAQDRDANGILPTEIASERLLCLVNAPAKGGDDRLDPQEIAACETRTFHHLRRCGLQLDPASAQTVTTTPADFAALFPGTRGSLYGAATAGPLASFRRPAATSRMAGLYLAGGSCHPGAGVPMAAISGRLAAARILRDFASTSLSAAVDMPGGTPMPSATTVRTHSS